MSQVKISLLIYLILFVNTGILHAEPTVQEAINYINQAGDSFGRLSVDGDYLVFTTGYSGECITTNKARINSLEIPNKCTGMWMEKAATCKDSRPCASTSIVCPDGKGSAPPSVGIDLVWTTSKYMLDSEIIRRVCNASVTILKQYPAMAAERAREKDARRKEEMSRLRLKYGEDSCSK
jgi:hypothetical protein